MTVDVSHSVCYTVVNKFFSREASFHSLLLASSGLEKIFSSAI